MEKKRIRWLAIASPILSGIFLVLNYFYENVRFFPSDAEMLIAYSLGFAGFICGIVALLYIIGYRSRKGALLALIGVVCIAFFFGFVGLFGILAAILAAVILLMGIKRHKIEMLAAVGVLLFLFPHAELAIYRAFYKNKRVAGIECLSNQRLYSLAIIMYADDNGDHLPPQENWQELLRPYMDGKLPRCPDCTDESTGYIYIGNEQMTLSKDNDHNIPILMDSEPRHVSRRPPRKRRNVLLLGMRCTSIGEKDVQKLLKQK